MANPNIVNVTSIYGQTGTSPVTTSLSAFSSNPADSGKIRKINTLIISNAGASAGDITVHYGEAGFTSPIIHQVSVPANSSLTVIDKSTSIYVLENNAIYLQASSGSSLYATISYEDIS